MLISLMPHGSCFLWDIRLTTLHASSDLLTAIAYGAICIRLTAFFRRKPQLWLGSLLTWLSFAFIGLCGLDHAFTAYNIWHSAYWSEGWLKLMVAIFSWTGFSAFNIALPRAEELIESANANRQYQRILETLIEESPPPMVLALVDREMCYLRDYPRWRAIFNLGSESIAGQCHYKYFPFLSDAWKARHQAVLNEGMSFSNTDGAWLTRIDGKQDCIIFGISPWYSGNGDIGGMVMIGVSVLQLKETEALLQWKIKDLERSNTELEEFAYVVSHDLQAPLRTVRGFLELLFPDHFGLPDLGLDTSQKAELAQDIVSEYGRLHMVIRSILEWSRAGRGPIELESVDMLGVVTRTLRMLHQDIEESRAIVQVGSDMPRVLAPTDELQQVFQNLISNAIKFVAPDVRPLVHISAKTDGDRVTIAIADNGIGIDMEMHGDHIFGFRKRLHHSTEFEGQGIGLAICKKIVERCGGQLWCESQLGKGSTFYFSLKLVGSR